MIDRNFILAGNAIFTIRNTETGNTFTFKVRQPDSDKPHFVSVLTGPQNTSDYTFLGTIFNKKVYRHGKKSPISFDASSARTFNWFWQHIDDLPDCVEIYHEGYCGRCGRLLTVPESIESGIGPVCQGLM